MIDQHNVFQVSTIIKKYKKYIKKIVIIGNKVDF